VVEEFELELSTGQQTRPETPDLSSGEGPDDRLARILAAARREATTEGRLAAVSLTLFPVVIGVVLLGWSPVTPEVFRTDLDLALLLGASVLTILGGLWLWRLAQPPFALRPKKQSIFERQPETGHELSTILHRAVVHADAGMDVTDALERAAPDDERHPARAFALTLRLLLDPAEHARVRHEDKEGEENVGDDGRVGSGEAELPDWLTAELHRSWAHTDPSDTLKLVAARLDHELETAARRWPTRVRVAALVPFALCIAPAAVMLAVLAFR